MRKKKVVSRIAVILVLSSIPLVVSAGSSGTSDLFTIQGSGSPTSHGDFVSCDSGGLDTSHRYFIEVPPSASRLAVEIFDADIGDGGSTEDTAGRDRDRGGYDTSVTYQLLTPSGASVPLQFTTGDAAGPAGSDNSWLTLYQATGTLIADHFGTSSFSNNDGTTNWSGAWAEVDGGGAGAGSGAIRVTGGELRIQDGVSGTPSVTRQANLAGLTNVSLSFDYRTSNNLENGDSWQVQISNDGGATFTTLETFSNDSSGSRSYDISADVAANTRVRFRIDSGMSGSELAFIDNVTITDGEATPGHWELRLTMSDGDDINAFGLRAHDGTAGAGGTELNVYADSLVGYGSNPPNAGTMSRSYTLHPWITSGCSCATNDFDADTGAGAAGSFSFASRSGAFLQTFPQSALSNEAAWRRNTISGWTSDSNVTDYGIWSVDAAIGSYLIGGTPNGNYATWYVTNSLAAANPPAANPAANAFRIYLPTDSGAAPVKPYLEQQLRGTFGSTAPAVGVSDMFTVTVLMVNPTAHDITFSASNLVTANVPGGAVVYGGNAQVSQGSVVSQPAVGGSGNLTWNPGTLTAGDTVILSYEVVVTPTLAGQRIPVTGTPASGNATRARYLDETGNASQARATYLLGGLCELAVTVGLMTDVLLSDFEVEHGRIRFTTASEAGTIGFNLLRADGTVANPSLIPARRNGRYTIDDPLASPGDLYTLEELTVSGRRNRYGPLTRLETASEPRRETPRRSNVKPSHAKKPVAAMIGVRGRGIVRVEASDLAAALSMPVPSVANAIRKGRMAVTDRDVVVATTSAGDALLFFATGEASIYSNERVYRAELTHGETMGKARVSPASAPVSSFRASIDVETDAFAATVLPLDPESDYWFWEFVFSGDATHGRKTFHVDVPSVASAAGAMLRVRLHGAMADNEHGARILLNGVPVGDAQWTSIDAHEAVFPIPAAILRDGSNEIVVEGVKHEAGFDVFYIDGFTIEYERAARPSGGVIEMTAAGTVSAGPFASKPAIFDITDPLRPSYVEGFSFDGVNASFSSPGTRRYFAATALTAPVFVRGSGEATLKKKDQAADWVIITPRAMREAAESLARLRERDGLDALVVELEQVYDDFAGGNTTPHAIRAFIASTRTWSRKPRYVVLAGTGTVDYREIELPAGLMPPMMMRTADGLFASDSAFLDVDGDAIPDAIPDIAIGRIAVSTADELEDYVGKLERSEEVAAGGSIVFAADRRDRGADFAAEAERAASLAGARPVVRAYADEIGVAATRAALLDAWSDGVALVAWNGHGGYDQLSSAGVLRAADAAALTNTDGRLPVVVAMTCTINGFENGYVEPLGAALTRSRDSGALAVWSASGLSAHHEAAELQRTFLRHAAAQPDARLGDLILATLRTHATPTAGTYLLLGDPAVRLRLPPEVAPTADGTPGE